MKSFFSKGWNFMRILRLVMGFVVIVFAFLNRDVVLGLAGAFLVLLPVLNIGCCGVSGCPVPAPKQNAKTTGKDKEEIAYEEVV